MFKKLFSKSKDVHWTCAVCTYDNEQAADRCEICGEKKSTKRQSSLSSKSDSENKRLTVKNDSRMKPESSRNTDKAYENKLPEHWQCPDCTFNNEQTAIKCDSCRKERFNDCDSESEIKKEVFRLRASNVNNYLKLDALSLIQNNQVFECSICLNDQVGVGEGVVLKECFHMFCKQCLKDYILNSNDTSVKCPSSQECQNSILQHEIRALLTSDEYKQYELMSLKQGEAKIQNTYHCKILDCIGFCVVGENLHKFKCPVCRNENCIDCEAVHLNKTCTEFQNELKKKAANNEASKKAIAKMLENEEAMHCPGCKAIVMKDDGCDWIMCAVCRMEICWATKGPRWGPKGNGDTTGGCQCRMNNGKLCHPRCSYCH